MPIQLFSSMDTFLSFYSTSKMSSQCLQLLLIHDVFKQLFPIISFFFPSAHNLSVIVYELGLFSPLAICNIPVVLPRTALNTKTMDTSVRSIVVSYCTLYF